MELFAVGFMVMIAAAAVLGVLVGAIGGAVAWRLRMNLVLGGLLTACAFLLVLVVEQHGDVVWLRAKLAWGIPALTVAFLVGSVFARWLDARTRLRPAWTTLAAFGFSLCMGFFYLLLFRLSPRAPLLGALIADVALILLLLLRRRWLVA